MSRKFAMPGTSMKGGEGRVDWYLYIILCVDVCAGIEELEMCF